LANNADRAGYLNGLAACVRWTSVTGRNKHLLQSAHHYLKGIDANTLKQMRVGFNPPAPTQPLPQVRKKIRPGAFLAGTARILYRYPREFVRWIVCRIKAAAKLIQRSRKVRRVLTGILLFGLILGIGVLVVNTVRHLTVNEAPSDQAATPPGSLHLAGGRIFKAGICQKPCSTDQETGGGCILVGSGQWRQALVPGQGIPLCHQTGRQRLRGKVESRRDHR